MNNHLKHLPAGALKLIADMGEADAMHVLASMGGTVWRIPHAGQDCLAYRELVECIGERMADKLAALYGTQGELYIPNCRYAQVAERNTRIEQRLNAALELGCGRRYAAAVVALEFGLSSSYVLAIIRRSKQQLQRGNHGAM
ncbi:MAG: Mor transcription activator family protein [Aeromonas veronii]